MNWHLSHRVHGDKPWEVQTEAMRRSEGRAKYAYWLEMGLGKTPLTLNDFVSSNLDRCLVVVPNTFKVDWALAPEEWGVGDDIQASVWPLRKSTKPALRSRPWLMAMNYEAARSGTGRDFAASFMAAAPTMLVIDESSAIKSPTSDTTKAILSLAKEAKVVRELNGTPLVQNVMDYWGQLRAIGEINGVNPYQFRNRFGVMGGFMAKQVVGMKNQDELYRILDRCSFRALKSDWRDLPPKTYATVHLEMTATQRRHYQTMMEEFFTQIDGMDVTADLVLTQMNKLRQISSCLAMQDGMHRWLEEPNKNPKIKATLDLLSGGKTIVWHFYRPSGDAIYSALDGEGFEPAFIRGGMSPDAVSENKRRFNEDTSCRAIVCQIEAASRGHTLLGGEGNDRCTKAVYYENSFSLLHRLQSEDRNHRGEQDQACICYDLVTSPMDQITVNILQQKKNMADGVDAVVATVREHKRHDALGSV